MNRRTALWLVCILCGLLGVYLWQNRPAPAVDPNAPDPSIRTIGNELGLTAETIQAVRLRNLSTGQQVLLRKNSTGQWQTPELVMGLDDQTARLIVRSIELLPYRETIPISNATNLGQYGFAPEGQFSVEVLLQSGVGHVIAFGSLTPSQRLVYALIDDHPQIYLLLRDALAYLQDTISNLPLT